MPESAIGEKNNGGIAENEGNSDEGCAQEQRGSSFPVQVAEYAIFADVGACKHGANYVTLLKMNRYDGVQTPYITLP